MIPRPRRGVTLLVLYVHKHGGHFLFELTYMRSRDHFVCRLQSGESLSWPMCSCKAYMYVCVCMYECMCVCHFVCRLQSRESLSWPKCSCRAYMYVYMSFCWPSSKCRIYIQQCPPLHSALIYIYIYIYTNI
jgi:hypothetical protein